MILPFSLFSSPVGASDETANCRLPKPVIIAAATTAEAEQAFKTTREARQDASGPAINTALGSLSGAIVITDDPAAKLDKILADMPAAGTTIIIPPTVAKASRTLDASSDRTLPAGVTLQVMPGAPVIIPTGRTFSLKGTPDSGPYQIFTCTGTGRVVFGPGSAPEYYPQWFGAAGDGTNDNYPAFGQLFQSLASLNSKVKVTIPNGTYKINPTTPITIPVGVSLECQGIFTTSLAAGNMPTAFFQVVGDGVTIDGMKFNLGGPTAVGNSGNGIGIQLTAGVKNFTLKHSDLRYFSYCVLGSAGYYENIHIYDNDFVGVIEDVVFAGPNAYGRDIFIDKNRFPIKRDWSSPMANSGSIVVAGGIWPFDPKASFSDAEYETRFFENVHLSRNQFYKNNAFPVLLTNISKPEVIGNDWQSETGGWIALGRANDNLVLDLCRDGVVQGNTIYGGGQNGIDLLSCQHMSVTGNRVSGVDTVGLDFDASMVYQNNPAITLSKKYLRNYGHSVTGNFLEGQNPVAAPFGDDIILSCNTFKYHPNYSSWTTVEPVVFSAVPLPAVAALIQSDALLRPGNIRFKGNNVCLGEGFEFTANAATDTLTTIQTHDLATGESVELETGGNVATVALPGGLTYYDTYWIIRVSPTQVKLAATRAQALAGQAIHLTANGGGSGQKMYLKRNWDLRVYWTNDYLVNSHQESIELEEEVSFSQVVLFSTLGNLLGVNYGPRKHFKAEYILDPSVAFGGGGSPESRSRLNKYQPVPRFYANGVKTYGIDLTHSDLWNKSFIKGSLISPSTSIPADGRIRLRFW